MTSLRSKQAAGVTRAVGDPLRRDRAEHFQCSRNADSRLRKISGAATRRFLRAFPFLRIFDQRVISAGARENRWVHAERFGPSPLALTDTAADRDETCRLCSGGSSVAPMIDEALASAATLQLSSRATAADLGGKLDAREALSPYSAIAEP